MQTSLQGIFRFDSKPKDEEYMEILDSAPPCEPILNDFEEPDYKAIGQCYYGLSGPIPDGGTAPNYDMEGA